MKLRLQVKISGKVQGVWFRLNTKKKADDLNINGWVKNTIDGKVEAIFEGNEENLHKMIKWCLVGSPNSKVKKIEISKNDFQNEFNSFSIIK
jgi:acylphosphatase